MFSLVKQVTRGVGGGRRGEGGGEGSQVITASWERAAILHGMESGDVLTTLTGKVFIG